MQSTSALKLHLKGNARRSGCSKLNLNLVSITLNRRATWLALAQFSLFIVEKLERRFAVAQSHFSRDRGCKREEEKKKRICGDLILRPFCSFEFTLIDFRLCLLLQMIEGDDDPIPSANLYLLCSLLPSFVRSFVHSFSYHPLFTSRVL